jgi:hypothetical protein
MKYSDVETVLAYDIKGMNELMTERERQRNK